MLKKILATLIPLSLALFLSSAHAAGSAGTVLSATNATATNAAGETRPLARRDAIEAGDTIKTAAGGKVQVKMKDEAIIALEENSELAVKTYTFKGAGDAADNATLQMVKGSLVQMSGQMEKSAYKMETRVSTLGIRGTSFKVSYNQASGDYVITVLEGTVTATDSTGKTVEVAAGKTLTINSDGSIGEMKDADPAELANMITVLESAALGGNRLEFTGEETTVITDSASTRDDCASPCVE